MKKPIILICLRYYLPGSKSGGPVRSIANIVERLGDEFDFKIITSDRDALDKSSYSNIKINEWNRVGNSDVYYLAPEMLNIFSISKVIKNIHYDLLYVNSFFDLVFTLFLLVGLRLKRFQNKPVLVAPRGEFSPGAIKLNPVRKRVYIFLVKLAGIFSQVSWHASTEHEQMDIQRYFGSNKAILIARNLSSAGESNKIDNLQKQTERSGVLRIIFLSRISPKKNLDYLLELLSIIKFKAELNIYGPIDDPDYWDKCQILISQLPKNISSQYHGAIDNDVVKDVMALNDIFVFPTRGENFGHVIAEALLTGTPVLTSDQTPWVELENHGAGWAIPLSDKKRFCTILNFVSEMHVEKFFSMRENAYKYGLQQARDPESLTANRALFSNIAKI